MIVATDAGRPITWACSRSSRGSALAWAVVAGLRPGVGSTRLGWVGVDASGHEGRGAAPGGRGSPPRARARRLGPGQGASGHDGRGSAPGGRGSPPRAASCSSCTGRTLWPLDRLSCSRQGPCRRPAAIEMGWVCSPAWLQRPSLRRYRAAGASLAGCLPAGPPRSHRTCSVCIFCRIGFSRTTFLQDRVRAGSGACRGTGILPEGAAAAPGFCRNKLPGARARLVVRAAPARGTHAAPGRFSRPRAAPGRGTLAAPGRFSRPWAAPARGTIAAPGRFSRPRRRSRTRHARGTGTFLATEGHSRARTSPG